MSDKPSVAVIGDSWISMFAEYVPTSLARGLYPEPHAFPAPTETAVDFMLQDGAYVASSLLGTVLENHKAVFASQVFSPKVNRLLLLRQFDALGSYASCTGFVRRIGSIRYLQNVTLPKHTFSQSILDVDRDRRDAHRHVAGLIIDDGGGWRESGKGLKFVTGSHDGPVIVVLGSGLPDVDPDGRAFKDRGWQRLSQQSSNFYIVLSASLLRHSRAYISRRLSWDKSVEDLCREIATDPTLNFLHSRAHLIIRFGTSAAVYVPKNSQIGARLVFDADVPQRTQRDFVRDGRICGKSTMLASGAIKHLLEGAGDQEAITEGLKLGLMMMRERFARGYLNNLKYPLEEASLEDPTEIKNLIFGDPLYESIKETYQDQYGVCELPERNWKRENPRWTILSQMVPLDNSRNTGSRINLAEAIVYAGYARVLNTANLISSVSRILSRERFALEAEDLRTVELPSDSTLVPSEFSGHRIDVPVLRIADYISVERREIECIRAVRNLMTEYINACGPRSRVPLSLAVFGHPGAGKSFAVKQIASDLRSGMERAGNEEALRVREYNLAQLSRPDDLMQIVRGIRDDNIRGRVPIVFIDEFDSDCDSQPFGWLKYFLAPMQDGSFKSSNEVIRTGRAILVFAGGTSPNFASFSQHDEDESRRARFVFAKGPDFVSRLRGYIDVASLNPMTVGDESTRTKPVIRRAVMLRTLLESANRTGRDHCGLETAMVDEDVVFALLTISRYRHEARSLQAILDMCTPLSERIAKTSLPPDDQLSMHVDAQEFHRRMHRSRLRPRAWTE